MSSSTMCFIKPVAIGALLFTGVALLFTKGTFAQGAGERFVPTITNFRTAPMTTDEDGVKREWLELSWETQGADLVRLYKDGREIRGRSQLANGELGWPLSMQGGFRIQPGKPAVLELVAENSTGKTSKTLDVQGVGKGDRPAPARPEIMAFNVTPQSIKPGDTVSFYWQVKDAQRARLYDDSGEIESRVELANGELGWPLIMNGTLQESLSESTTYRLVASSRSGNASKSFTVKVAEKDCRVSVTITGKHAEFTETVGVYQAVSDGLGTFLFKQPVSTVRDHRRGADSEPYQRSIITVPPGDYFLVPSGGGQDQHGYFGVIYEPGRSRFACRDGSSGRIAFRSAYTEY